MEHETNTIHIRKSGDNFITVTETNTKITYTTDRRLTIGRLVIEYTRVKLLKTARARFTYFAYNNRLARLKRAVVPAIQRGLQRAGLHVYTTY